MTNPTIKPSTVTKPIQLLAAWLVGLVLVDATFLTAAAQIAQPSWVAGALVVASIVNVPLFLGFLFFMQTKFRPEMQEDTFYSSYLQQKFSAETRKMELVEVKGRSSTELAETKSYTKSFLRTEEEASYEIVVNDLLPNFQEITSALQENGLTIDDTFGSTSEDAQSPEKFVVTFGRATPLHIAKKVVLLCSRFGLDGIGYASHLGILNKIYVGSYVYETNATKVIKFSPEVLQTFEEEHFTSTSLEALLDRLEPIPAGG